VKHLLLLIVLLAAGYGVWQLLDPQERNQAARLITRHGLRLGALVLVVLVLVALAYHLPSTNIL
jgi:uncharacterized membrane protein YdjX (TVP38/TMEM64 family)